MSLPIVDRFLTSISGGLVVAVVSYFTLSARIDAVEPAVFAKADLRYVMKDVSEARYQLSIVSTEAKLSILERDIKEIRRLIEEIGGKK